MVPALSLPRTIMDQERLAAIIDAAWESRDNIVPAKKDEARDAIEAALDGLDAGRFRVAEKRGDAWHVNEWLKKAVLL
jgi:2,3,4,5-tetrahydropyridine-2-carboxylate N-succinyltransferase